MTVFLRMRPNVLLSCLLPLSQSSMWFTLYCQDLGSVSSGDSIRKRHLPDYMESRNGRTGRRVWQWVNWHGKLSYLDFHVPVRSLVSRKGMMFILWTSPRTLFRLHTKSRSIGLDFTPFQMKRFAAAPQATLMRSQERYLQEAPASSSWHKSTCDEWWTCRNRSGRYFWEVWFKLIRELYHPRTATHFCTNTSWMLTGIFSDWHRKSFHAHVDIWCKLLYTKRTVVFTSWVEDPFLSVSA